MEITHFLLLIFPLLVFNSYMIVFKDYPNFENLENLEHLEKGRKIFQLLQKSANIQGKYLKHFNNPRQFWISNSILVEEFDKSILQSPDILQVYEYKSYKAIIPEFSDKNENPTWNVAKINVNYLWDRNFTGKSITVANIDTGVSFLHPGLVNSYRGKINSNNFVHDYNWFDGVKSGTNTVCGIDLPFPCDDVNHGSFTMGVQLGNLNGQQYGPAIGSKWISCRGFNQGSIVEGAIESCLQFMLAPTLVNGSFPNPDLRPDVLSNSYGVYDSLVFQRAFAALNAAGVMIIAALGNTGTCGVQIIPASYPYVISVSSSDINDVISSFSSRGPVLGSNVFKPELISPGTNIVSFTNTGGITTMSGTSFSSPLISGLIAVLWEAVPSLKNKVGATRSILMNSTEILTSLECNSPQKYPNYAYGYGLPKLDIAYTNALLSPKCFNYYYFDSNACSSNGTCLIVNSTGICQCNKNFYGNECEFAINCFGIPFYSPTVCSGRGICNDTNQCICNNSTYYGNNCQLYNVTNPNPPIVPRNNSTNSTIINLGVSNCNLSFLMILISILLII